MKNIILIFVILIPLFGVSQHAVVPSQLYSWKKPTDRLAQNVYGSTLLEGSVHDMEYLSMSSIAVTPSKKKTDLQVPANEEHLLLIKSGVLTIRINDSTWSIGGGSVALLMPGQKYSVQNATNDSCTYYLMKYRSKSPMDIARGAASGGSLVRDWNKITFKPHDKGGIRNYFERPTAMSKRLEMHVTTLKEGIKSHEPHTHRAEEIVLIINNKTEMQIGEKFYKGGTGDIYYLGSNVSHAIRNDGVGTCTYFAFQFE
ncbi:cupin domain-containing protein [Chryseolinea sp. H1M3-3]|uniref:cupin domain-containing protein n=1 Tax=Chryseolinea sp. H1M3-3 TaxID=3034144 RepID=UPI0023ECBE3D|nr:cupin domain-containing protein [Chryseolinea sp. H1M3-3]